jgi:hypothetical protein
MSFDQNLIPSAVKARAVVRDLCGRRWRQRRGLVRVFDRHHKREAVRSPA